MDKDFTTRKKNVLVEEDVEETFVTEQKVLRC